MWYLIVTLFRPQVIQGNTQNILPEGHTLTKAIIARCIRFHVKSWSSHIAMRIELYGCTSGKTVSLMLSYIIKGHARAIDVLTWNVKCSCYITYLANSRETSSIYLFIEARTNYYYYYYLFFLLLLFYAEANVWKYPLKWELLNVCSFSRE